MSEKLIAIMQPTFMPWIGYFSMIDKVDEFVFLDSVQLVGRSWQVRNKIKLNDSEKMLTIPICKTGTREERKINNTKYVESNWKKSHLETMKMAYHKADYYKETYGFLSSLYQEDAESIGAFNIKLIKNIAEKIGIRTPMTRSTELNVEGKKDELLVNICQKVQAASYLSAQGSAAYIEADTPGGEFAKHNIALLYQNYAHPEYKQIGEVFLPFIGICDLLFNVGFEQALEVIRSGVRQDYDFMTFREKYM